MILYVFLSFIKTDLSEYLLVDILSKNQNVNGVAVK